MRKILCLLSLCVSYALFAANPMTLNLHNGWKVGPSANPDILYDATVPSTAMGVLMDAGALDADLLNGTNYKNFDGTMFDQSWSWSNEFVLPRLDADQRALLEIDGVSYRTDVLVNGKKVATADEIYGPFRRFVLDITDYIGENNKVEFIVSRAVAGEPNIGFVDWNPRAADGSMGLFRPVRVRVTGGVSISSPAVKSVLNTETLDEAVLAVEATLTNKTSKTISGRLEGKYENGKFGKNVTLLPNSTQVITITDSDSPALYLKNPRVWWSSGMGSPEMYCMNLEFIPDGSAAAMDEAEVCFGIRKIETFYTDDNQRAFLLNGKPVLVRSAGWTDDIFLRNDSTRYEIEAEYVRDMGLNSIRFENIWGTSGYIYDLCDRLGLLALVGWSCQWEWENYLGSPVDEFGGIMKDSDMDLIAESLGDQVKWLRNHPSIIAWFTGSDMLPRPALEKRYLEVLASIDDRPYFGAAQQHKSEVTGYTGTKMAGPYEYVSPGYWYAPEAPGGAFGFNTETGIGAQVPQKESMERMLGSDVWPLGEAWDYHCTTAGEGMNSMKVLSDVIERKYGAPVDLNDFMQKAEWINYDGTRTMFEAFRARVPRSTGIVQWMLNSAWPSTYWQLYDYYLVPTSAYYSLKHSNNPMQIVYDYGKKAFVIVNETGVDVKVNARIDRYGLDDSEAKTETTTVLSKFYQPMEIFAYDNPQPIEFVFLTLTDCNDKVIAENFYVLSAEEDVNDWENSNWFITPVTKHADMTSLNDLQPSTLKTKVSQNDDTLIVSVENAGETVAFFTRLAALDSEGNLMAPSWWSDNFMSLRPGEKRVVTCRMPSAEDVDKAHITIGSWNTPRQVIK